MTEPQMDESELIDIIEQAIFETGTGLEAAMLAAERIVAREPTDASLVPTPERDPIRAALEDWAGDFDEGWGDRFASGDFTQGGFTLLDHGDEHTAKEFRLLRALRAAPPSKKVGAP